ncbi:hypothetical protein HYY72_04835 [Candidatus Woesearchaeota archaeon]|nr:hypothetical protein [Candidatus Woesearchaeota archaeon]
MKITIIMLSCLLFLAFLAAAGNADENISLGENMSDFLPCFETWKCVAWGDCVNGLQTRECFDLGDCNTYNDKPVTSKNCSSEPTENVTAQAGVAGSQPKKVRGSSSGVKASLPFSQLLLFSGAGVFAVILAFLVFIAVRKLRERAAYERLLRPSQPSSQVSQQPESVSGQVNPAGQASAFQPAVSPAFQQPKSELEAYVEQSIAAGSSREQVRADLVNAGWPAEQVDAALQKF